MADYPGLSQLCVDGTGIRVIIRTLSDPASALTSASVLQNGCSSFSSINLANKAALHLSPVLSLCTALLTSSSAAGGTTLVGDFKELLYSGSFEVVDLKSRITPQTARQLVAIVDIGCLDFTDLPPPAAGDMLPYEFEALCEAIAASQNSLTVEHKLYECE